MGRHTCYRCGGSCQGPGAPVLASETARIEDVASTLGIPNPIHEDRLRTIRQRCVFLQRDNLCAIHQLEGPEAKPSACQTYPRVVRVVGDHTREGVDPGCLTGWLSPPDPPEAAHGSVEERVLSCVERDIGWALGRLEATPGTRGILPAPLAARLDAIRPQILDLLLDAGTAPGLRVRVRHLRTLGSETPIVWTLQPEAAKHALQTTRRMVQLGLDGEPESTARATLVGAALCAAAGPRPERFGPALAAWTRLQRTNELRGLLGTLNPR